MFYFSTETIYKAFDSIKNNVENKFFGLLGIIRCIETTNIKPNYTYSFRDGDLSRWLDGQFYMSEYSGDYSDNVMYVKFSKQWYDYVASTFIKSRISVFSIIAFLYKFESFAEKPTLLTLLSRFCQDYHLDTKVIQLWFNTQETEITFTHECPTRLQMGQRIGIGAKTISLSSPYVVSSRAGELSRAPFVQTLYAGLDCIKCLLLLRDDITKFYSDTDCTCITKDLPSPSPRQQIFYGAPGTGKSYRIKEIVEHYPKENIFRTTFHPDSDYSTFVGCYKPTKVKKPVRDMAGKTALDDKKNEIFEDTITYSFVPQAFLKAYIRAWNLLDSGQPVFLIIEEINRGNCAQIFGDLFQLLDRRQDGYSEYPIKADTDLAQYLNGTDANGNDILTNHEGIADSELNLPPNLYIWGTMNTSDQSLFPIDSAFKRRWNWKYIKISDAKLNWGIQDIQDNNSWYAFIEQINKIIMQITNSADKQLGYFFCQPDMPADQDKKTTISLQRFVDKVVFYLWNDVFKDNTFGDTNLFVDDSGNAISFPDFYDNTDEVNQPTTLAFIRRVMQWGKSSAELQQDSE